MPTRHEGNAPSGMRAIPASEHLEVRVSTDADLDELAVMNRELIEDEGHRNPMTVPELKERFRRFVSQEGYRVDLFLLDGEVAGYATHRHEPDSIEPGGYRVFLRQFYIRRDRRGAGLGSRALQCLIQSRFKSGDRIFLDVMETNPGGKRFWMRSGFNPYYTTMEFLVHAGGEPGQAP